MTCRVKVVHHGIQGLDISATVSRHVPSFFVQVAHAVRHLHVGRGVFACKGLYSSCWQAVSMGAVEMVEMHLRGQECWSMLNSFHAFDRCVLVKSVRC